MARGYFRRLKSRVHSTHSSLTAYNGVIPSISSSSSAGEWGQEGAGLLSNFPNYWKRWGLTAHGWSAVEVIFSDFLDFLCICSCSFLLSFSLCFSIFSWALRAFSRDIFISFSFFFNQCPVLGWCHSKSLQRKHMYKRTLKNCWPLCLWWGNHHTMFNLMTLVKRGSRRSRLRKKQTTGAKFCMPWGSGHCSLKFFAKYTPEVIKKILSKLVTREGINRKGTILLLQPSAKVLLKSSIVSKGNWEHLLLQKAPRWVGKTKMASLLPM